MLDCLIIGDSIAVGTAHMRPECASIARGGWNSQQWNNTFLKGDITAKTVIISLGSNDIKTLDTAAELEKLRAATKAERVYWILPAIKPYKQEIVRRIAAKYNDTVLPIQHLQPDGVHPNGLGYRELARATQN